MHPAFSIIFFTTLSGAGYGLLFVLGFYSAFFKNSEPGSAEGVGFGLILAFLLIAGGLMSSTLHLKHPERAWRGLTQWRSSWLSREGVMAIITFAPLVLLIVDWLFPNWFGIGGTSWQIIIGVVASLCALITVYCTAMIYATLKPIRQWIHGLVVPIYLGFAALAGTSLTLAVFSVAGSLSLASTLVTVGILILVWALKLTYWRKIAATDDGPTTGDATGLAHLGTVRPVIPPHTQDNYLLTEMGFRVAQKHSRKLRRLAVIFGMVLPVLAILIGWFSGGWPGAVLVVIAAVSGLLGILVERWLFFAEARHTVTAYY